MLRLGKASKDRTGGRTAVQSSASAAALFGQNKRLQTTPGCKEETAAIWRMHMHQFSGTKARARSQS